MSAVSPLPSVPVALGAKLVERHTLDRNMEGPDHLASLEPTEFRQLVDGIRQLELALPWQGPGRHASQGELLNRENLGKSVIAAREIPRGAVLEPGMLRIASPGQGLAPYRLPELLGKPAQRDIAQGDFLFESDLQEQPAEQKLAFDMPIRWGVPVRYHDFLDYRRRIEPDLFEFHLSYRDLSLKPQPFLAQVECSRLVVHAPSCSRTANCWTWSRTTRPIAGAPSTTCSAWSMPPCRSASSSPQPMPG
jgi:N-acetylneuraminate synthase